MTLTILLSKPEFWSALFGALAAFLLGALATWWTGVNAKRTAGNLAIIALSQMYSLTENLRRHILVDEPTRARKVIGRDPYSFELRAAIGLPSRPPQIPVEDLGFLADSHDPDILNRLLTIERAFDSMLYLIRRHEEMHGKFQLALNEAEMTPQQTPSIRNITDVVGSKLLIDLDTIVEGLQTGLPETCEHLLAIGGQLRDTLRMQFPARHFIRWIPASRSRLADQPPGLPKAALWRRVGRGTVDWLCKPIVLRRPKAAAVSKALAEQTPPEIKRFPPRSWEAKGT